MEKLELAKAYVQIVPSAQGIKGAIANTLNEESNASGKKAGFNIASAIKSAIITAGIGKALQSTIAEGANLEQSIGGIETMFKDSADKVKGYAKIAYQTAGVSANKYMEQVTSFSASLLKSLDGDTDKATESANRAIIDMSDNANKFGTSIEMIQHAYQGFARGNYMMLDNLKLGYSGTKEEMKRLLADASKLSGIKYDISNLSDIYDAIHEIQKNLEVSGLSYEEAMQKVANGEMTLEEATKAMGTTAKEASKTVSGSFKAMSSSVSNLMGAMTLGEDIKEPLNALLSTTSTFMFNNLIPMIGRTAGAIPKIFSEMVPKIVETLPSLMEKGTDFIIELGRGMINGIPNFIADLAILGETLFTSFESNLNTLLPNVVSMIGEFVNMIATNLPTMISSALDFAQVLGEWIASKVPFLIQKGFEMLSSLVDGIISALPVLIEKLPQVISIFANIINDNFPTILMKGAELLWQFITGIIGTIPTLIENIPQIINAIVDTIMAFQWLNLGKNIIDFFGKGIKSMVTFIKNKATEISANIVNVIKQLPQTLFNFGKNSIQNMGNAFTSMLKFIGEKSTGIFNAIINIFKALPSNLLSIGENMIRGLWNGISNMWGWIMDKIGGFASGIINSVKDAFGIHSPSRVFRDEVGKYLSLGLADGITNNLKPVDDAIEKLKAETMGVIDTNVNLATSREYSNVVRDDEPIIALLNIIINEYKDSIYMISRIFDLLAELLPQLANMQLVMDNGAVVGELATPMDEELGTINKRKER